MDRNVDRDVILPEINKDRKLGLFIASYYILSALNISIKVTFQISDSLYSALSNMVAGGMILGFIYTFRIMIKRAGNVFIAWEFFAFILFLS